MADLQPITRDTLRMHALSARENETVLKRTTALNEIVKGVRKAAQQGELKHNAVLTSLLDLNLAESTPTNSSILWVCDELKKVLVGCDFKVFESMYGSMILLIEWS